MRETVPGMVPLAVGASLELWPSTVKWVFVDDPTLMHYKVDVGPWHFAIWPEWATRPGDKRDAIVGFKVDARGTGCALGHDVANAMFKTLVEAQLAAEEHILALIDDMLAAVGERRVPMKAVL